MKPHWPAPAGLHTASARLPVEGELPSFGGVSHDPVPVDARGVEASADWASLRSPETYTGYERTENFASPSGVLPGTRHAYTAPAELRNEVGRLR